MKAFDRPLTAAQERQYLELFHGGDKKAKEILIEKNLRLVVHMVKKYSCSEYELEDMISIGTIGLIKAIDSFDEKKGNRLVTYAAKCIDNELLMMFRSEKKRSKEVSLNEPLGTDKEGNKICFQDITFSEDEDVVARLQNNADIAKLNKVFNSVLSDMEKEILIYRYGLYGRRERTQRELADEYGISRSYVSRIEKRALERLRDAFRE
ncbi:rNA polymerase sigma factor [Firmicutes bacterium CAG:882]|jgi:RNA polymerase sporulation-specific sigma factor|nr:rNA polymerase sigma factor [Firmicutes bacterium CAG:882]